MALEANGSKGKSSIEMSPGWRPISSFGDYGRSLPTASEKAEKAYPLPPDYERLLPTAADKPFPRPPVREVNPTWFVATDGPTATLLSRNALEEFNRREVRNLKLWKVVDATFRYNGKYDLYELTLLAAEEEAKKENNAKAFCPRILLDPPVRLFALVAIDLDDESRNNKVLLVHEVPFDMPWPMWQPDNWNCGS